MITRRLCTISVAIIAAGVAFASPSVAAGESARRWFTEQGYAPPSGGRVFACHGYGCSRRLPVMLDGNIIPRAAALLGSTESAEAERRAIGEVVRIYTAQLARELGGAPDRPGSPYEMSGQHGQMDCLDETANTTSLLGRTRQPGSIAAPPRRSLRNREAFSSTAVTHISRRSLRRRKAAARGRWTRGDMRREKRRISCRSQNGGRIPEAVTS